MKDYVSCALQGSVAFCSMPPVTQRAIQLVHGGASFEEAAQALDLTAEDLHQRLRNFGQAMAEEVRELYLLSEAGRVAP